MIRHRAPSRWLASLALASIVLGPAVPAVAADPEATAKAPISKGERRLAKLLEGRAAGQPVSCINTFPHNRMQAIEGTALVYGTGKTIYVQRTTDPKRIDSADALVTNRFNPTQLCRADITTTIDRTTGIFSGVHNFEDFIPYTRAK